MAAMLKKVKNKFKSVYHSLLQQCEPTGAILDDQKVQKFKGKFTDFNERIAFNKKQGYNPNKWSSFVDRLCKKYNISSDFTEELYDVTNYENGADLVKEFSFAGGKGQYTIGGYAVQRRDDGAIDFVFWCFSCEYTVNAKALSQSNKDILAEYFHHRAAVLYRQESIGAPQHQKKNSDITMKAITDKLEAMELKQNPMIVSKAKDGSKSWTWYITDLFDIQTMKDAHNNQTFHGSHFTEFNLQWHIKFEPLSKIAKSGEGSLISLKLKKWPKNEEEDVQSICMQYTITFCGVRWKREETITPDKMYLGPWDGSHGCKARENMLQCDDLTIKFDMKLLAVYDGWDQDITFKYVNKNAH